MAGVSPCTVPRPQRSSRRAASSGERGRGPMLLGSRVVSEQEGSSEESGDPDRPP